MIGFNTFLESEGISPAEVKLVRHQDIRTQTWCLSDLAFCSRQVRFGIVW